jgi:putative oxidoreductase
MLVRMLSTNAGFGMFWVRLPLAITMIYHGYEKLRNVPGFIASCDNLGIPPLFAYLALIAEFFGGIGVLIGFLSRLSAFGIACTMLVAGVMRHLIPGYGYLMNWHGALPLGAEGFEFHTLAIGMSMGIMTLGAGSFSVDAVVSRALAPVRKSAAVETLEPIAARHGA